MDLEDDREQEADGDADHALESALLGCFSLVHPAFVVLIFYQVSLPVHIQLLLPGLLIPLVVRSFVVSLTPGIALFEGVLGGNPPPAEASLSDCDNHHEDCCHQSHPVVGVAGAQTVVLSTHDEKTDHLGELHDNWGNEDGNNLVHQINSEVGGSRHA